MISACCRAHEASGDRFSCFALEQQVLPSLYRIAVVLSRHKHMPHPEGCHLQACRIGCIQILRLDELRGAAWNVAAG